jgi:glycosyltransferase involved in cell wall biosynthesis
MNGFDRGGAELSLPRLIDGRLFAGFEVEVVALIRGHGGLEAEITAKGISPIILVDERRMSAKGLGLAVFRLFRHMLHSRPDIVVLSLPQANIAGRVIGSLLGLKVISFEHNTVLAKPVYETLFRLTARAVDVIFVDCAQTGIEVRRKFYAKKKIPQFIVPLKHFVTPPSPAAVFPSARPRIVTVGRLTHQKNQGLLIETVSHLSREGLEIDLDIIGEGDLRRALGTLAREKSVSHLVNFPGFVPEWWLRNHYDAFVLTSSHEGLCIVALEAMWAGIPLIATRVGGIQDYGTANNMMILPERPTTIQLGTAIRRVVTDPGYAGQLAENAQVTIEERFSTEAANREYQRVNDAIRRLVP